MGGAANTLHARLPPHVCHARGPIPAFFHPDFNRRPRNYTGVCAKALAGFHRRSGIAPCPEGQVCFNSMTSIPTGRLCGQSADGGRWRVGRIYHRQQAAIMGLMRRMGPMKRRPLATLAPYAAYDPSPVPPLSLPVSLLQPRPCHTLFDTALVHKVALQAPFLLV